LKGIIFGGAGLIRIEGGSNQGGMEKIRADIEAIPVGLSVIPARIETNRMGMRVNSYGFALIRLGLK
jgi:hypothetical protein